LQADGKLLVAGSYVNEATPDAFALARYNLDGSLDSTFGSAGVVTTRIGAGAAVCLGIALQRDGRIVLAGYSDTTQGHDFTLACYNSSGALDSTFGNGGVVATDFSGGTDDIAYALTVQRDGKLVAGGQSGEYPFVDFGLARYTDSGQLDQTFGAGGKVISDFSNFDSGYAVTIQRDGKIILSGVITGNDSTFDMGVARYLGR
jgi:uncharacterized delta-60 repeat protein